MHKPIEKTFSQWNSNWFLEKREGDIAIYRQEGKEGGVHYNTVNIRKRSEQIWPNGNVTPAREAIPSESEWGIYGFTYQTLKAAEKKFNELLAQN